MFRCCCSRLEVPVSVKRGLLPEEDRPRQDGEEHRIRRRRSDSVPALWNGLREPHAPRPRTTFTRVGNSLALIAPVGGFRKKNN